MAKKKTIQDGINEVSKISYEPDIFEEALAESISSLPEIIKNSNKSVEVRESGKVSLVKVRKNWSELKKAIDEEHAERFNNILNDLPDREFARVYLKALEFFKPKVIRSNGNSDRNNDRTINIQINYGNK